MRKTLVVGLIVLVFTALPAAAQKVYVDFDASVDFESFKSFAWANTAPTSIEANHPYLHAFIKETIEYRLTQGGMIENAEEPDLLVTYHAGTQEEFQVMVTSYGYSYGGGWSWDPFWGTAIVTTGAMVNTYDRSMLVIDIWDARKKQAVFRGTASKVFSEKPEKLANEIEKAIEKIGKKFRQKYEKTR
jgi:hypothetical protein